MGKIVIWSLRYCDLVRALCAESSFGEFNEDDFRLIFDLEIPVYISKLESHLDPGLMRKSQKSQGRICTKHVLYDNTIVLRRINMYQIVLCF